MRSLVGFPQEEGKLCCKYQANKGPYSLPLRAWLLEMGFFQEEGENTHSNTKESMEPKKRSEWTFSSCG